MARGMGIIVLAVAIIPLLGIGGMQLYRAEMPGPLKEQKMRPRIAETAKALWLIYLSLTILCAVAFWLAGMTVFDAISHSFSTVSIGGFLPTMPASAILIMRQLAILPCFSCYFLPATLHCILR